jgi:DNA-binding transcriptional LysR family regulator
VRRVGGGKTTLRLGVLPYLDLATLEPFLTALAARCPDLDVQLTHALTPDQMRRIRARELDAGIFPWPNDDPSFESEPIFGGAPMAVYMPMNHPLASTEAVTPADLRDEVLVMFPRMIGPVLYDWWLRTIAAAGYTFRDVYIAGGGDPQDMLTAVARGKGVGFSTVEFGDGRGMGTLVTSRPPNPPIDTPQKVLAWPADPPRHLSDVFEPARAVAREMRAGTIPG